MKKKVIGIAAMLTAAGVSLFALTQGTRTALQPPPTETPTATAAVPQPCAYVWAYEVLPEVSAELQAAVQAVVPEASAFAQAFGENCVAADGSATFSAMETDFYIRLPVADLNDNITLGNLIEEIWNILDQFPRERLRGPNDGFAEFAFFLPGGEQRVLRVPIPRGRELLGRGLRGAELIQALETP